MSRSGLSFQKYLSLAFPQLGGEKLEEIERMVACSSDADLSELRSTLVGLVGRHDEPALTESLLFIYREKN